MICYCCWLTLHKYLNRLYAITAPVCVCFVSHPQGLFFYHSLCSSLSLSLYLSPPLSLTCDFVGDCLHNALAQKPIAEWLSLALARSVCLSVCLSACLSVCLCGIFSYLYDFISHEFYINKSQLACTQVESESERERSQATYSLTPCCNFCPVCHVLYK